jgi:hypothetical protein
MLKNHGTISYEGYHILQRREEQPIALVQDVGGMAFATTGHQASNAVQSKVASKNIY